MDNQVNQPTNTPKMPLVLRLSLMFVVGLGLAWGIKYILRSQPVAPDRPATSQPYADLPQVTKLPRKPAEVEAGVLDVIDPNEQLSQSTKIETADYQVAITAAWQELIDKKFATRDASQPNLATVQYPVAPNSTQLQTKVIDINLPVMMSSSDQPVGFGYNQSLLVNINVTDNHQLELVVYQAPGFKGLGVVQALDITFDAFAILGRNYTGPLPVITAFSDYLK
ncbi:MAG: hypothetical protein ABIJ03_02490 [Patescibacteria group bacterium]|nr:hypothetical protein [Patescibacteria group bacterium]